MSLKDLRPELIYETSTDDIIKRFYGPALSEANRYDRGVGFFTSSWLRLASTGLSDFAKRGGIARFLVSVHLEREDAYAINAGELASTDSNRLKSLMIATDDLAATLEQDTLAALAWLVANGKLEFRVVEPKRKLDGDFHDKFGIFSDSERNSIAFCGSQNDSNKAFRNSESIRVDYSWMGERESQAIQLQQDRFNRIWANLDSNLAAYKMPQAILDKIIKFRRSDPFPSAMEVDKWRHQDEASAAFLIAKHGILEMATGTGKTKTAISIIELLLQAGSIKSAVVITSGNDLLDQWYRQLIDIPGRTVWRAYESHRQIQMYLNNSSSSILLASRMEFANNILRFTQELKSQSLLVADEVHGLGSEYLVRQLTGQLSAFAYTLGLSATPEREYGDEGNAFVTEEIGDIVFRFSLHQAIERGILCEFDYIELEYAFSQEDRAEVSRITAAYHSRVNSSNPMPSDEYYQKLARVRKLSRQKIAPFAAYISRNPSCLDRSLIFVETAEYGLQVQHCLLPINSNFHTYYGSDERENLTKFARGDFDALITCHRVSEGVDIKSIQSVILFSASRAKLETIQRLGRCLRKDPAFPGKRALVIDFIRTDDLGDGLETADSERRAWFRMLAASRVLDTSSAVRGPLEK